MTWIRRYRTEIWFGVFHGLALSVLTLIWMNLSWEFGDEVIVSRINQIARYEIFNPRNKVVEQFKKELLLLNTSYDKTVIPFSDDYGEGNLPVTDRQKLADFINLVASSSQQPKLIVVDLLFDNPSDADSALHAALKKVNNLVISSQYDTADNLIAPWPGLTFALALYETTTGTFLKYNLMNDTVHYLPAAMLHETHGTQFRNWAGLVRTDPGWWMNSFIVDLPVRKVHMDNGEILTWNLSDALQFDPDDVRRLVANRIIIIGDFYRYDTHDTLLGEQPGPLIVANAYLGMLQGIPRIKLLDGFMIFMLYFTSTLYVLIWRRNRYRFAGVAVYRAKVGRFMLKYLTYLVVFSLYSIFLYLLTSRHFQLLLFGLYFNLFEYVHDRFSKQVLKPAVPEAVIDTANVD
jgi:hypothetical protein